jgi:hypothetical protein
MTARRFATARLVPAQLFRRFFTPVGGRMEHGRQVAAYVRRGHQMTANLRSAPLIAACALLFSPAAGAQTQNMPSCTSAIQVRFDKYGLTQVPAGSTLWFTAVLKAVHAANGSAITSPIRVYVRQSHITFGGWPHIIAMPDSTVVLDPSISVPRRLWSDREQLRFAYSPSQVSKEALFDALPYAAPEPFIPRSSGPVTWTATFAASRPGITIDWAWSAAVYSQFGAIGSFQLKPLSGPIAQVEPQAGPPELYDNADPAGTAEAYKQYVVAGAMGSGAPSYTGARSETASVIACQSSEPPPTVPTQAITVRPPQRTIIRIMTFGGPPAFASPISQRVEFGDGSVGQTVDRCYATDLCALISYANGDQLAIYSEGAARCKPYVLHFNRTNGGRAIYGFSRELERDQSRGARCPTTRATRIAMDGGRIVLTVTKNLDGTLKFKFASP